MSTFTRVILVVAALFIVLLFVTKRQLSDAEKLISEQSERLVKQSLELLVRDGVIDALQSSAIRNEQAQAELRTKLSQAGQLAAGRERTLTRLLNENADLRRWYSANLPDDVKRLHRRPAFDNPDDYLRWLSESNELPDTGQQPGNQR
ncbi:Rz-like lysis system protein LysB [Pectobacterium versatile]|uniref:Rz-like lysis system protein LysB n=1 Tax=Pectobacterium versatile TaxID=2488639 RepID=UPI00102E791E|nr:MULTISPECIES: Rz-like lysis system protein LysB [Pectobacterium]MBQ4761515.1 LysB family phage lysis regulatory protein [Pectobacterium versatile]MCA6926747.1 Rz-like lysis system protein LysB [Pectobacterium versatile]MCH5083495.1 LysB family phage lysis regulatory protein [Pectobacterium versatile]MCL6366055.1 LysB family phage lysis regulatory protein [Pectobacterium carotovorum subsp. carotovorum]TAI94098.1 LysB family phage lysis regulatory protein [Pectobacterium versatile]